MRGRPAAAQIGVINDVVVHQGSGLEHLNRAGQIQHRVEIGLLSGISGECAEGIQRQQRAQPFAAFAGRDRLTGHRIGDVFAGGSHRIVGMRRDEILHQFDNAGLDLFQIRGATHTFSYPQPFDKSKSQYSQRLPRKKPVTKRRRAHPPTTGAEKERMKPCDTA